MHYLQLNYVSQKNYFFDIRIVDYEMNFKSWKSRSLFKSKQLVALVILLFYKCWNGWSHLKYWLDTELLVRK